MNSDEAARLAREWFDGAPSLSLDKGFEIVSTAQFDFKEWEVECRIFSTTFSKMVDYVVIIHDDKAVCVR